MGDLVAVSAIERRICMAVRPVLESMGFDLVRLRLFGTTGRTLQVMVERGDGRMNVEDCAEASHAISSILDAEDPIQQAYTLEVSSPGIDRPLTRADDFPAWKGHFARVELRESIDGQRRFKGTIVEANDGNIRMRLADKEVAFQFESVTSARLVTTRKLLETAAAAPEDEGISRRERKRK